MTSARFVLSLWLALAAGSSSAQAYPAKPIRYLIPILAGSVSDLIGRSIGQELSARLGQPLIVENRPVGAGIVSAETCAKAAPDGYTVCIVNTYTVSVNPHIFSQLPYEPQKDFKPVSRLYYLMAALLASGTLPARTVDEVRALAVAKPGVLNFATNGPNSGPDLIRQWIARQWKTELVEIGYKGGPPIMAALMSGEVQLTWQGAGNVGALLKTGKLKVLALGSEKRSPLWPDVPTTEEVGLRDQPLRTWFGLMAPAGTPDAVVARLSAALADAYRAPKLQRYLEAQFVEPVVESPASFAAFLKKDREEAARIVREYKIPRQ